MELWLDDIDTPIGPLVLVADQTAICALDFAEAQPQLHQRLQTRYGNLTLTPTSDPHGYSSLIQTYFAGEVQAIAQIPVHPGGTAFQQRVWTALRQIPPGTTLSYQALAQRLGHPKAVRAVGMANARNPIVIVIPCHRVIGAKATLTGYSGGLERKQWLLQHEGVYLTAA